MNIHYNAFISYRHHPDDIKVARQIHRSLERFHIPKAIRKKRQGQGSLRLFRDKEELPITSNLNDDIDDALRNSDYLIVICSVHTKESIWVQREIELFLKTHHRSKVLTVLASGEPYDVIPEILLKEDVVDPETGEMRQVLVEPLSCDWRMKRGKAVREELPRLAAPLLGCAYDELRQRQRQYRTRRLVAILTAALVSSLALAAYFLQTSITIHRANIQIQANLEQSLRNQSRHLATAAREKLTEGDRLSAIALAAAALPGEGNERPYVPEAEFVLTDALGIYQPVAQVKAVGTVGPGGQVGIRQFWVSEADHALYIYDVRQTLTVWDTQTMEKKAAIDLGEGYLIDLAPLPQGNALVHLDDVSDTLYCYGPDGTCLWQADEVWRMALLDDSAVLVIRSSGTQSDELHILDTATGQQIRQPLPLDELSTGHASIQFPQKVYTSGQPLLIRCSDGSAFRYCLIDLDTGSFRDIPIPDTNLKLATVHGGKLFVMGMSEGNGMVGAFESSRITAPIANPIRCYDLQTAELLWESAISSATFTGDRTLAPIPGQERLLCQSGAVFQVLDIATGETLARCEAGSSVISVTMGDMFASCILEDGYRCNYWYDENYCYESRYMESGLAQADGFYALKFGGSAVMVYREQAAEESWLVPVEGTASASDSLVFEDLVAVQNYSQIYLYDITAHAVRWQTAGGSRKLLAFSQDGAKLWCADGNRRLVEFDTATGVESVLDLEAEAQELNGAVSGNLSLQEDILFYTLSSYDGGYQLVCRDMTSGESTLLALPESAEQCRAVKKYGQYLWLHSSEETILEADLSSGSVRKIQEGVAQCLSGAVSSEGTVALAGLNRIFLLTPGAGISATIELGETACGSLCFFGNQLLALCDDGFIHRFDSAGALLSKIQLQVTSQFAESLTDSSALRDSVRWQFTQDGKLVLNAFRTGNVVDCESWKPVSSLTNFLHFSESENCFICYINGGVVGYHRCNLEELLTLAQQALGSFSLTVEQKASYGLE